MTLWGREYRRLISRRKDRGRAEGVFNRGKALGICDARDGTALRGELGCALKLGGKLSPA